MSQHTCTAVKRTYDVAIVGAGMAGLTAARRLKQAGYSILLIDKGFYPGGRLSTQTPRRSSSVNTSSSSPSPLGSMRFDTGAQFFTTRDPIFTEAVQNWVEQGIVAEWCRGFPVLSSVEQLDNLGTNHSVGQSVPTDSDVLGSVAPLQPRQHPTIQKAVARKDSTSLLQEGFPRYICPDGGMRQLMQALAKPFVDDGSLFCQTQAHTLKPSASGWDIHATTCESQEQTWKATSLLLTMPIPQTLTLLSQNKVQPSVSTQQALAQVRYDPCVCLMIHYKDHLDPPLIPSPGGFKINDPSCAVAWIASQRAKGLGQGGHEAACGEGLVIHATAAWSKQHYDLPEDTIRKSLWHETLPLLQRLHANRCDVTDTTVASPNAIRVKKWKFAIPTVFVPASTLVEKVTVDEASEDKAAWLALAGDAFSHARVEGAFLSGHAAAGKLMACLTSPVAAAMI